MLSFPVAPKKPHVLTQHGQSRVDDYYWLRNREDPEVLKYLQAEMDYLEEVMSPTRSLQETLFSEMKGRIQETDSTVPYELGGYFYYQRTEAGKQYPIYCRKKGSLEAEEEILLDQNLLAEGQIFCSVSALEVSLDGNTLVYSVDLNGDEVYTIYIKDLVNNTLYEETIPNASGSVYYHMGVEWANDNKTFFYTTLDESKRAFKVYRHKVGTEPSNDVLVYHEQDTAFSVMISKTRDNRYIFTEHHSTLTTESRFLPADEPESELMVLSPRRPGIEYYACHHKNTFFILTNENARNFKLVKAPDAMPGHEHWQEVLPHREDTMLTGVDAFENYLVMYERRDGLPQLRISDTNGISNVHYVDFPEPTYYYDLEDNSNFNTNILRIGYSSLVTPYSVVNYHMDTREWELLKEDKINDYNKSQYVCELVYATAADGKQIPVSISYKKGLKLDGSNPTLLHGYGAYGSNLEAQFMATRVSLLDRGFVYAIGHIRGSSTLGRAWYEDGKVLRKRNSFTDFITCAEYLIQEGYTSKDKLAILGVSAGGLLVSACMTMRPDLYKAVIAKVPFVDVINSMSDPSIPLTTHEYDEWGNPANKEHYEYMMSYSPYDNIQKRDYPNLLLTAGYNDPRVAYWEPAKFAAKLRKSKTDNNLLVLRTNFHAGHAGSSGRYDNLKEVAFEYSFLIDRLLQP